MLALPLLLLGFFSASPATAATSVVCANEAGQQRKPALVVKAGGGNKLFLCAVNRKKSKGRLEVSGFKVFSLTKAGKKRGKPVFVSELENKNFAALARGNELVLQELIWTGKSLVPGFETVTSCEGASCKASASSCVFKKPASADASILPRIDEFRHGKRQGKVPDPKLINRLAALAYSGNEEAQAIFQDRGAMSLDGEASERYYEHQEMIARLKKAACFP